MYKQTGRLTDKKDKQTDNQTDRQINIKLDEQTSKQTMIPKERTEIKYIK